MTFTVREECHEDEAAVRKLLIAAFGREQEADLVDALRSGAHLAFGLVAEEDGKVIGYAAVSHLSSPEGGLALAPVAVSPHKQRRGTGSRVVRAAVDRARTMHGGTMFVVGAADYYGRFGFSTAAAEPFPCVYAGAHFMALPLSAHPNRKLEPVVYPEPFAEVD